MYNHLKVENFYIWTSICGFTISYKKKKSNQNYIYIQYLFRRYSVMHIIILI